MNYIVEFMFRKRKRRKKRSLSVIRVTDDSFHPDFTKRSNSHTSSSVLSTVTNTSTTTSVPFIKTPSYNQSTSTTTGIHIHAHYSNWDRSLRAGKKN